MKHLAIFRKNGAEKILSGKSNLEIRFSKSKIAPFGVISSGDLVYIKTSGGEIIGQFRVKKVIFFDGLQKEDIVEIKNTYGEDINIEDSIWREKADCKFATLIFIESSEKFITSPIKIPKKDLRGWVVLD